MNEQEPGVGGGKFDPTRHLRQLRGRGGNADYLDVKWRLVWLRSEHPDAQITTEHVTITSEMAIFKAQVTIPGAGSATGYGSETAKDFGDFIEKAETKALGRALIALGYGTQFAQEFGEDDSVDLAPPMRAMPPRPEPARVETPRPEPLPPTRPTVAPQPAVAQRQAAPAVSPRPEPIPADSRRPAPVRPLRDAEPEPPSAPTLAPAMIAAIEDDDDDPFAPPPRLPESPAAVTSMPTPRTPTRLSPPQPAPRPAPRPTAAPAFTREPTEEAEEEAIDMANYGWTEFWSWARARGFNDRKSLDAVVGRATNGMTPLEIRKHIQAKQG